VASARQEKVETGKVMRLDEPSDSPHLWDAVRMMVRLLKVPRPWSVVSHGAIIGARRRSGRVRSNMPAVPANEKIGSLFEPARRHHRRVRYGHKLNLTTGRSGLILDPRIKSGGGNLADSERSLPMLKRHKTRATSRRQFARSLSARQCKCSQRHWMKTP
jgi:hypothetical protein